MKPAISYGLIGYPARRFRVMAITSETRSGRGRVWGRDALSNRVTNAGSRDCYGRFETYELAEQARAAVQQVYDQLTPGVDQAQRVVDQLRRERRDAVDNAMMALPALPVAALEPAPAS